MGVGCEACTPLPWRAAAPTSPAPPLPPAPVDSPGHTKHSGIPGGSLPCSPASLKGTGSGWRGDQAPQGATHPPSKGCSSWNVAIPLIWGVPGRRHSSDMQSGGGEAKAPWVGEDPCPFCCLLLAGPEWTLLGVRLPPVLGLLWSQCLGFPWGKGPSLGQGDPSQGHWVRGRPIQMGPTSELGERLPARTAGWKRGLRLGQPRGTSRHESEVNRGTELLAEVERQHVAPRMVSAPLDPAVPEACHP